MSKRQFLEEMVQMIIENKVEDAREKFHQFVVESAREIHASLIETDELDGDIDEDGETVEESFEVVEADSEETEDFGSSIDGEGDVDVATDVDGMGDEMEVGGEEEAPAETVEVTVDSIDDIKAQLADLQAKFDALNGTEELPGEEVAVDAEVEGPEVEDFNAEETFGGEDDVTEEGFDLTEEDLLGLEEGFHEVTVSMTGGEQGGGKFAGSEKNTKTPVATHDKPETLTSKQDAHKGYAKEAAPNAEMKSDSENVSKSGKGSWTEIHQTNTEDEIGDGEKFATPAKSKTTPVAKN